MPPCKVETFRVLFVDQSAELGGAELSLIEVLAQLPFSAAVLLFEDGDLVRRLAKAGVAVEVIGSAVGRIEVRRESGILAAARSLPAVLALAWSVAKRARGYDLIYANSQKAFVVCALSTLIVRRKLVWHLHDILTAEHFGRFLRRFAVRLANWRADWVIANSQATAAAFENLGGGARRLSVVHQGIDEAPFAAVSPDEVAALRTKLGAGPARKLLGVFGRLAAWKGQAVFLQALALVPDAIGVIVGDALFGEDEYARALYRLVETLGLMDRVKFLGFREDVPALMSAMDVIVHSSVAPEPFGRVVVEGMLAGRPVIASAAGGVLEIIADGRSGFLYEAGNAQALAAVMMRVIAEPELASRVAQAGREHARLNFSVESSNDRINGQLGSLMRRSGGHN
jgi:glycosyltransferase involved in cell wall biosynthesis